MRVGGMASPDCAHCGRTMDAGFILDHTHGGTLQSSWVGGLPDRSRWTGLKLKGRTRIPVTTLRCPRCGRLEAYALHTGTS
jgi:hypothetical protein